MTHAASLSPHRIHVKVKKKCASPELPRKCSSSNSAWPCRAATNPPGVRGEGPFYRNRQNVRPGGRLGAGLFGLKGRHVTAPGNARGGRGPCDYLVFSFGARKGRHGDRHGPDDLGRCPGWYVSALRAERIKCSILAVRPARKQELSTISPGVKMCQKRA